MSLGVQSGPAFGKADLSNCEREQIHLAASIQPFGALLLLSEPELVVVQASANAQSFLGLREPLIGASLSTIPGDLCYRLRPHLDDALTEVPVGIRCRIGDAMGEFDGLLHRPAGGGLVIELERSGRNVDLSRHVQKGLGTLLGCPSLESLCDETARVFRQITGYDRVMVYRFDEDGHGQVFSERKRSQLESFLGNWYPASDIPQMARRLYERNRVRILVDVACEPAPLVPRSSPISGRDLDMSMCFLRSMSPLHIQYLKNMGVAATLVVSLMVGGRLWGLVACHHYAPRFVHFEVRAVCELLAEAVATRIAALDAFVQAQAELSVRRLEQRMVDAISSEGDWRAALFDRSQALLSILRAQGAALLLEGEVQTTGDVPGTQPIRMLRSWLDTRNGEPVSVTASLSRDEPALAALMPDIGGVMAVPVSDTKSDYLIWFRPERVKTVTWGGNPTKPFLVGQDPLDLSPRRSFAQWHELVEGTCEAWSAAEQATARMIGEMVADVVLQFRAVRMLIVQDQLDQVGRQVHASGQPVVIADPHGRVLLTNEAFRTLLAGHPPPAQLPDLAGCFAEATVVDQHLRDLIRRRRAWRGEFLFHPGQDEAVPLLVRGDPVLAAPGRVLGFVLLFIDVSQRRAAESARARFLDGILTPHRFAAARMTAAGEPMFHGLMATVIENAQMAALEITDGVDLAQMPKMLDAIRSSVDRTAEVLERLIWHATRASDTDA